MEEEQATSGIVVRRVWRHAGEGPGALHLELVSGEKTCEILLKKSRTPRLFNFLVNNSEVGKETELAE